MYTQNSFIKYAINSLIDDKSIVDYFNHKNKFLVTATILKESVLIIDSLCNSEDVRWLYFRLKKNKRDHGIIFISSQKIKKSLFTKDFKLINDLFQLQSIFRIPGPRTIPVIKEDIHTRLINALYKILTPEELYFLLTLYDIEAGSRRKKSRFEINKIYYIRSKKLSLGSSTELMHLILLLIKNVEPEVFCLR